MTFEPIINMADAVRQPRGFLAQTAAWLGVITADMPMQNWYVYNHIMYARWLLEDATSALNAQVSNPHLIGTSSSPHPLTSSFDLILTESSPHPHLILTILISCFHRYSSSHLPCLAL